MFSTFAYYELVDPAGVFNEINAVADQTIFTSGTDLRVPDTARFLIGSAALINDASATRAQLVSPSLRRLAAIDVEPIVQASVFGLIPEVLFHPTRPYELLAGEGLRFQMQSDPAAAAAHYGLIWLADGPQRPLDGSVNTVYATGQNVGAAGVWTLSALTFDQQLPVGRYQVVGLRARSTTAVAMRLVFPGSIWRPGVPVINAVSDPDLYLFRFGNCGVFGEFHTNAPPQMEILGAAGSVPVIQLDLVPLGA
jgi:hypothetical protein